MALSQIMQEDIVLARCRIRARQSIQQALLKLLSYLT
jgi:hypothetical protein